MTILGKHERQATGIHRYACLPTEKLQTGTLWNGAGWVPTLPKPQQQHPYSTITAKLIAQLYCFMTNLCRVTKLTKIPSTPGIWAENWVLRVGMENLPHLPPNSLSPRNHTHILQPYKPIGPGLQILCSWSVQPLTLTPTNSSIRTPQKVHTIRWKSS